MLERFYTTRLEITRHSRRLEFLDQQWHLADGQLLPHEVAEAEIAALQLIAEALRNSRQDEG